MAKVRMKVMGIMNSLLSSNIRRRGSCNLDAS